jgi:hypothetical protein
MDAPSWSDSRYIRGHLDGLVVVIQPRPQARESHQPRACHTSWLRRSKRQSVPTSPVTLTAGATPSDKRQICSPCSPSSIFGHDRLQRVADQLARAAQLEHGQRRPQPRQSGIALPLLVAAARAAAVCRDPARVVLAAVVLLIWSIVKTLPRTAEGRHHQPRASARQHIAAAADELADHPILRSNGGAKAEAPSWSRTGVRKPVAQKSSAPSSVLDLDRRPTVHKPATPRTGGRTRSFSSGSDQCSRPSRMCG